MIRCSAVVVPSSSSEMSSSSVAASSEANNCDALIEEGARNYTGGAVLKCTTCHGSPSGTATDVNTPINIIDAPYEHKKDGHSEAELDVFIAKYMSAYLLGANSVQQESEAVAAYLYDAAGWDWCADNTESSSSSSVAVSSSSAPTNDNAKVVYAINVGGTAAATFDGVTYEPAGPLSPQVAGATNGTNTVTANINGTDEDALFQSQRYGNFTFELPVTASEYNITLYFAEEYAEAAGTRLMSAVAENKTIMNNVDLFDTHGRLQAITYSLNDVGVTDGNLTIEFTASANLATLSGILVTSVDGAKGEIVVPPNPCDGTDNFVCLDFEDVQQGDIPSGWSYDGVSPVVDTAKARSGSKALKAQGMDYGSSGYITYPGIPSKHWGRMYYQMSADLQTTNYLHITLVELLPLTPGHAARVVDTNLANNDLSAMKYILNVDANGNEGGLESPTKFSYYDAVDKWVCVEWMVDPDTQKGALWADGELAYNDVLRHPSPNQIPSGSFDQISIGCE
ncbi:malectin domain-containing carbohydrate-binding protein [Marinagarivorans cellulosilyticus]|uniref:Cytochrome c domain-containing protein n=1 Tax=Marinagarivorans cellulosilyticus TaxID=2721545 RepID=A0AAN1WE01_9GAMM|nr:malectin domain-containing carbohydrate-binding protein [Marinagarivorans cellulosilyticus]BCD95842.1 hypothetical protein MARGE09_P0041 [Marinagarivorans cellulosilyticus]